MASTQANAKMIPAIYEDCETYEHNGIHATITHTRMRFDEQKSKQIEESFAAKIIDNAARFYVIETFSTLHDARSWVTEAILAPRSFLILKYSK